jgi:hypothetical protein
MESICDRRFTPLDFLCGYEQVSAVCDGEALQTLTRVNVVSALKRFDIVVMRQLDRT